LQFTQPAIPGDTKVSNEYLSSAAVAALSDKELCQTSIAAAVGCSAGFGLILKHDLTVGEED
jgi:hypothetical protein